MAKKIVRGITDVKTINNQDFDTNNVNDLLSDGQYNYIHRKKGKGEEYHNLTDNIKTLSSDNTDLLTVTNNNKTTNTATLHPKHDAQKEQVLESTRNTVTINHGTNGTAEKTTVDTNPQKVLEHENLVSASEYVTIEHDAQSEISQIKTDKLKNVINELSSKITSVEGKIPTEIGSTNLYAISKNSKTGNSRYFSDTKRDVSTGIISARITGGDPYFGEAVNVGQTYQETQGQKIPVIQGKSIAVTFSNSLFNKNYVSYFGSDDVTVKKSSYKGTSRFIVPASDLVGVSYITLRYGLADGTAYVGQTIETKVKVEYDNVYTDWSPAHEDVEALIAQKQDKLTAGDGITIEGQTISASGLTSSIEFSFSGENFQLFKYVVKGRYDIFVTYTFDCDPAFTERVFHVDLKNDLEKYVRAGMTISNGAITLTNDGTKMKLIKSGGSQNVIQQGTFTFYRNTGGGGGSN